MEAIYQLFDLVFGLLKTEFEIFGFTFTFWGILIVIMIAGIVGDFIYQMLN